MPSASTLSRRFSRAWVTGASGGLGAAFVEMLLQEGIHVTGTARDRQALATRIVHPRFTAWELDLDQPEAAAQAFAAAETADGAEGFDLVIANAGYGCFGTFAGTDFAVWQRQLEAMLTTTTRLSHAALRTMLRRQQGCLVQVSSLAAEFPLPYMSGYNMAKAGLSALSESLMLETCGTAVRVLDFRPGDYRTDFNRAMRTHSPGGSGTSRQARAWQALESHLEAAPPPARAAQDLRRALLRGRSGVVRSGSIFQAHLAPLLSRFLPQGLRRAIIARYQGAD